MDTKECVYCNEIKPLSEFNIAKKNGKHTAWCKVCGSDDAIIFSPMPYKECSKCHEVKPSSEYLISKSRRGGLGTYCNPCHKKHMSEYGKKNRKRLTKEALPHIKKYLKKRYKEDPLFKMKADLRSSMGARLRYAHATKSAKTIELLGCTTQVYRDYIENKFEEGMTWENYGREGWHLDHIRPCASFDLTDPQQQKECFHYTNLQPMWASENISKGAWYNGVNYKK